MPDRNSMTPRERWLAVLNHQKPDHIPTDYWATGEFTQKIMAFLGCDSLTAVYEKLHIDTAMPVGPAYRGPTLPANTDIFGSRYANIDYGSGSYAEVVYHPLAQFKTVDEIKKNYTWPDPDWWDYKSIPGQAEQLAGHPIRGGGSEPFLTYKSLRGQEQGMLDLIENPEIVQYCLDQLFELAYQHTLRILEAIPGRVDLVYVAEDMGSQKGLMFSPRHIRKFLLPGMKRMIDLAHQAGAFVFHHNDGNVLQILPEMVDAGIDLLNPIQWRADGMDRQMLKQTYGDKLIFHGAVDNQYTLPFGTVAEVEQEVLDNIRILGAGGGYILAPCHNIQSITPVENVIAMYEMAYRYGAA
jgi:uroporphyrinogen decarboxylase